MWIGATRERPRRCAPIDEEAATSHDPSAAMPPGRGSGVPRPLQLANYAQQSPRHLRRGVSGPRTAELHEASKALRA